MSCSCTFTTTLRIANMGMYFKTYLNKLEKLRSKALRKIFKMPLRDPITPFYRRSVILKFNHSFNFEVVKVSASNCSQKNSQNF